MSSVISNSASTVATSVAKVVPNSVKAPEQFSSPSIKQAPTDAEVIAKVLSTEIKPSNVSQASQPTQEVIAKIAKQMESFVQSMGRELSFSIDQASGYSVIRVVNPQTGEVIRQLPSEELLKIAEMFDQTNSALINQKA
jgi:flagellar protein FlaG